MGSLLRRIALLLALCAALGGALHLPHAHAAEGGAHACPCLVPAAPASEPPVVAERAEPAVPLIVERARAAASAAVPHARSRAPPAV